LALLAYWSQRARPRPVIVGMGRLVQRVLAAAGIPHRALIHPAARGAIRQTACYRAHVAAVLSGEVAP
ncbi:MAG: hypothetical protein ACRDJN_32270, partial [Chloroflexota bacterium]